MKKLIATLALGASVLVAAAPASAQSYRGDRYDDRYDRGDRRGDTGFHPSQMRPRLDRINQQISRGVQRGVITRGEAARLNAQQKQIWQVATNYYRTGGVNRRELQDIEFRLDRLQQQVRFERRDNDNRRWR
jgi:hypothetical protein